MAARAQVSVWRVQVKDVNCVSLPCLVSARARRNFTVRDTEYLSGCQLAMDTWSVQGTSHESKLFPASAGRESSPG